VFAKPVLGGSATAVATSVTGYVAIGGPQIATFLRSSSPSSNAFFIVDATGKLPTFELNPTPDNNVVAPSTGGGFVAYTAGGSIYAVQTN
jgi:hypothetical protein